MSNQSMKSSRQQTVLICTGGTGGHTIPAQALAHHLRKQKPDLQLHFAGFGLNQNRYFNKSDFAFTDIASGAFPFKKPWVCLRSGAKLMQGFVQSRKLLEKLQPQLVVGFGSYHTLPILLAARFSRVPMILHAADSIPGKVIRILSKNAVATSIHFPEAASYLKGSVVETNMPLRDGYEPSLERRLQAYQSFGLDPTKLTLLVFGGSQGAKTINEKVVHALTHHLQESADLFQVLHYSGTEMSMAAIKQAYAKAGIKALVKDFETRMDWAWSVADLVIARSGASSIAEQIAFEVPGILIPYPFSKDQHQDKNADYIVKKIGGALKYSEAALTEETLATAIWNLIKDEQVALKEMHQALKSYKKLSQKRDLSALVLETLNDTHFFNGDCACH